MNIRRATHADLDGICGVAVDAVRQLCRLHYSSTEIEAWVSDIRPESHRADIDSVELFVADDDEQTVLGFCAVDASKSEIVALYVQPTATRRRIGAALLERIEGAARDRGIARLHVDASLNSVEFYFTAGYALLDARRHRLRSWVEIRCISMAKSLVPDVAPVRGPPQMPIFLVAYDESWPRRFEEERTAIAGALGDRVLAVEHIGSTAIPGIMAKPIIDIMVVIENIAEAPTFFDSLERLEYHYFPYDEERTPERRWFCKPNQTNRTHHLHLVQVGSARHRDSLAFRDYLRERRDEVVQYEALKQDLAARFPDDREAYTEGKTDFVKGVLERAARPARG